VTRDGSAKLLDFGIAKLMAPAASLAEDLTQTQDGAILGTASYMSPEQVQGRPLDGRSDVFSFGAVLYEVLAGHRAFEGTSAADVLASILRDDPAPLDAPSALARLVTRCLAKQPNARYTSIADVRAALERLTTTASEVPPPSIAVLPFGNLSTDPENEYFSDGLAEEIINNLAHVPGLKVIARTSAFAFKGKPQDIRRIADALRVAHVLEGSVRRAGSRVRVTAQLIAAIDGTHLWSERFDRELQDIFAIQDDIAAAITAALRVRLADAPPRARLHKPVIAAHEALLKGRHLYAKHTGTSVARARECLEQAIELDPEYAEPHAQLGLADFFLMTQGTFTWGDVASRMQSGVEKALSLDPHDPSPRFLLGAIAVMSRFDWTEAAEHFRAALAGHSMSAEANWAYASLYLQPLGMLVQAVEHMERAVECDPLNALYRGVLASHLTHAGQFERAIREAQAAIEIDSSNAVPRFTLGETYVALSRWDEAADTLREAHRLTPQAAYVAGTLAGVLRRAGQHAEADRVVCAMDAQPIHQFGRVCYHLISGEIGEGA
jgi:TolB-like protein/cytochrome c-type biogenesis protein CcmH/NrfG